jgi:geranylgeranyl diphosphate synthase, type II
MELAARIETALEAALARAEAGAPPRLAAAMRHAVFPGGARVRPRLCISVGLACGGSAPKLIDATAAAVELLHCASLVHDDLPCFDDAAERRGRASVHALFGEAVAVLAGDGLIVQAFEVLGRSAPAAPSRLPPLLSTLARAAGAPYGLVAGQAWESEPDPPLERYHCAKTGALFVAATMGGAIAAGADPGPWRALGEKLGEAYQVADDLLDAVGDGDACGKPLHQDEARQRPNAVARLGVQGALARLKGLVAEAAASVPPCAGQEALRDLVRAQAARLAPKSLVAAA